MHYTSIFHQLAGMVTYAFNNVDLLALYSHCDVPELEMLTARELQCVTVAEGGSKT